MRTTFISSLEDMNFSIFQGEERQFLLPHLHFSFYERRFRFLRRGVAERKAKRRRSEENEHKAHSMSSSSSSSSSLIERPKSVKDLYVESRDRQAQEAANAIWEEHRVKVAALQEILDEHRGNDPIYTPGEVVRPVLHHEFTLEEDWTLSSKGDTTFTVFTDDFEREDGLVTCRTFDRDGRATKDDFPAPYDDEDEVLYFGVPISYRPGADYYRDENQIIIGEVYTPEKKGEEEPVHDDMHGVHEVNGVIVSDRLDPDLEIEKEAYVEHIGAVPYSVIYYGNDHYKSYLLRNMRTQERHFFVFERELNFIFYGGPFLLRGEFFFVAKEEHCLEDGEYDNVTHIIHARSHEIVYTWKRDMSYYFAPCTDFVVFSYRNDFDNGDADEGTRFFILM